MGAFSACGQNSDRSHTCVFLFSTWRVTCDLQDISKDRKNVQGASVSWHFRKLNGVSNVRWASKNRLVQKVDKVMEAQRIQGGSDDGYSLQRVLNVHSWAECKTEKVILPSTRDVKYIIFCFHFSNCCGLSPDPYHVQIAEISDVSKIETGTFST